MKHKGFFRLSLAVSILIYLSIVLSGINRAINANPSIQASTAALAGDAYRVSSLLVWPGLLTLAGLTFSVLHRRFRPLILAAMAASALQAGLGAWTVQGAPAEMSWIASLQLGLALVSLGLIVAAAVLSWGDAPARFNFRSPFGRLTLAVMGMIFLVLVSGALVSGTGSGQTCSSWPLCESLVPVSPADWINTVHRLIVGLAGFALLYALIRAWKTQRTQITVIAAATAAFVLFFSQSLMGWFTVARGYPVYMIVLHQATSAGVWAALLVQASAAARAGRTAADETSEAQSSAGRKGLLKDFLLLTKPIVVALLLVTTFTGMVIGAQSWPSLSLVFWTLLGGAMAAGGSGAINQYIDRYDDTRMQRTQKRPIPSGRMTPGEGLAWGIALCIASFFLLVAFVNLLAALLSLAGIIYYVLLYSIFLKKASVQNIVIGGGAGAIPPLVGWAAATGSLNIPSLFLFAVIFMWTPPHFWALAIVRKNDYARAGVPMLPVVRGEVEARRQILIYTAWLVALTLALPLFGLGQSIYLVSAVLLGLWLLAAAVKLWRQEGNKVAWKMYRYSSMYLAFLFVALMIDRLILR